jgi:hypothetical protein
MVVNETNPLKRLYKPIELQRSELGQQDSSGSTEAGKESFVDSLKGLIESIAARIGREHCKICEGGAN